MPRINKNLSSIFKHFYNKIIRPKTKINISIV